MTGTITVTIPRPEGFMRMAGAHASCLSTTWHYTTAAPLAELEMLKAIRVAYWLATHDATFWLGAEAENNKQENTNV